MTACSNDDEPKLELTAEYLEATTWDAEFSGSGYPNHTPITAHFVMQFLSKQTGKCYPLTMMILTKVHLHMPLIKR